MSADRTLSLSLRVMSHDGRPNLPDVDIHVDGRPAFFDVAPGWRGFDPDDILGAGSPLLPVPGGRWVALNRCTCGEPGCGTIAAWVEPSGDGSRVTWSDFRDFVGVFHRPLVDEIDEVDVAHSKPWDLPPMHFDRASYVAEVERASADRTWETPARRTARLLHERLALTEPMLPGGLTLAWVTPMWEGGGDGVVLGFQRLLVDRPWGIEQQFLRLTSSLLDPAGAADELAERLASVPVERWAAEFGFTP